MDVSTTLSSFLLMIWLLVDHVASHPTQHKVHSGLFLKQLLPVTSEKEQKRAHLSHPDPPQYIMSAKLLPEPLKSRFASPQFAKLGHLDGKLVLPLPDDLDMVPFDESDGDASSMLQDQWLAEPLKESELEYENVVLNRPVNVDIPIRIELPPLFETSEDSTSFTSHRRNRRRRKPRRRKGLSGRRNKKNSSKKHLIDLPSL